MREVPLTNGMVALVDDEDYARVSAHRWAYNPKGRGYAQCRIGGRRNPKYVQMHRCILDAPVGFQVDHINGNGLDNRRSNLRLASRSQNQQNTLAKTGGTSKYKGVHFDNEKQRFRARIRKGGVEIRLGRHSTEEEAALAYDAAARKVFGRFARLNFPQPGELSALEPRDPHD